MRGNVSGSGSSGLPAGCDSRADALQLGGVHQRRWMTAVIEGSLHTVVSPPERRTLGQVEFVRASSPTVRSCLSRGCAP